ncbi:choline-binding surface protein A [Streptococcus pneumoniae]|nr:choline-binding surface protein A [Streptococcus pneumoniae]
MNSLPNHHFQNNGSGALAVNTTVDSYRVNANGEWVN